MGLLQKMMTSMIAKQSDSPLSKRRGVARKNQSLANKRKPIRPMKSRELQASIENYQGSASLPMKSQLVDLEAISNRSQRLSGNPETP